MTHTLKYNPFVVLFCVFIVLSAKAEFFKSENLWFSRESDEVFVCRPQNGETYKGTIVIPSEVTSPSGIRCHVRGISDYCFSNSDIRSLTTKGPIETIGRYAFYSCAILESVQISNGVKSLGERSFANCRSLKKVHCPGSYTFVPNQCFYSNSSLDELLLSKTIKTIGEGAFYECRSIKDIEFGESLRYIKTSAFEGCSSLESLTFNSRVEIGEYGFRGCSSLTDISGLHAPVILGREAFASCASLTDISFLDDIAVMGEGCFMNCNGLREIKLKCPVEIPSLAFSNCSALEYLYIGEEVEVIGDMAFDACLHLKSILLKSPVNYIGYEAFLNCDSLLSIYVLSYIPPVGTYGSFSTEAYNKVKLYVPVNMKPLYEQTGCWENFKNIEETRIDPWDVAVKEISDRKIKWVSENCIECTSDNVLYHILDLSGKTIQTNELMIGERLTLPSGFVIIDGQKYFVR